ncbi:MAG TPA: phosphoribosyltransferase [Stellaceae bacterium]|nr:phosphoribosyltransferase [Stellaceae bacterium]
MTDPATIPDQAAAAAPGPASGDDQVKADFLGARAIAGRPNDQWIRDLVATGAAAPPAGQTGQAAPAANQNAEAAPAPVVSPSLLMGSPGSISHFMAGAAQRATQPTIAPDGYAARLLQAASGGAAQSLKDLAAAGDAVSGGPSSYQAPSEKDGAGKDTQPLGWGDLGDPATAVAKSVYQLAHGAPVLAAGIVGGIGGGAVGSAVPAIGTTAGALGGGALGAGAMSAAQSIGPYYAAALRANPDDPQAAFDRAVKQAGTDGVFTAAGWAAFGFAPFKGAVQNLMLQAFGVQPGVAMAQKATQNVEDGRPIGEGVVDAIPGAVVGTALPAAAHAAVKGMVGGGAAPAAGGDAAVDAPVAGAPAAPQAEADQPPPPVRTAFAPDFPDVVIQKPGPQSLTKLYPEDYPAAKAGDIEAASRVVDKLIDPAQVDALRGLIGDRKPIIVAVHADEAAGRNKLPQAYAKTLGDQLGLQVDNDIIQANSPQRTGQDGVYRLTNRSAFDGEVTPGADYLIADDHITQGGTLADLKGYIESQGGIVIGATTLTGKAYSAKLAPSAEALAGLRSDHPDLEPAFQQQQGVGYDGLTHSEARYLRNPEAADAVRDNFAAGGQAGGVGADGRNPGGPENPGTQDGAGPGAAGEGGAGPGQVSGGGAKPPLDTPFQRLLNDPNASFHDVFAALDDRAGTPVRDILQLGDPKADPVTISPDIEKNAADYLAGKGGENPVKVNLAHIGSGEDIARTLEQVSTMLPKQAAQSNDSTALLAASLNMKPADLLAGYKGQQLDAAQTTAMRFMLDSSAGQLIEYARAASDPATATPEAKALFLRAFATHQGLQQYFENARAEAGRTLQSWQIATRQRADMTKAIGDLISQGGGEDAISQMAGRIADLGDPEKASQFVAASRQMSGRDLFLYGFYNVILSNVPHVLAKKALSDATMGVWNLATRYAAETLGSRGGGGGVAQGETAALVYGYASSMMDGIRLAGRGILTGERQFDGGQSMDALGAGQVRTMAAGAPDGATPAATYSPADYLGEAPTAPPPDQPPAPPPADRLATAAEGAPPALAPDQPTRGALEYLKMALPTRWLGAADDFAKYVNYRAELRALAYREGAGLGKTADDLDAHIDAAMNAPSRAMHEQAVTAALRTTFQEPLQGVSQKVADLADSINIPLPGTDFKLPFGRMILPFVKIPANMAGWVYRNSPLAAAFPSDQIKAELAAGGATRDLAVARMGLGGAVALAAAGLAAGGVLTGRGPSDPSLNRAWRAAGNTPYAITIDGTPYVYNQVDPLGMTLGAIGDSFDTLKYAHDQARGDIASSLMFGLGNAMLSKTYMSGIASFFDALQQPEREGSNYVDRFVASLGVPGAVAAVDRATDPWLRAHYDLLSSIEARTPFASQGLPPQRSLWGDAIPAKDGYMPLLTGTGLARAVSPIAVGQPAANAEPIDQWIWANRAAFPHADAGRMDLYKPGQVQTYDAPGQRGVSAQVQLTPQEHDRLQVLAGNETVDPGTGLGAKDMLNALVTGDKPDGLTGGQAARLGVMQAQWDKASPSAQAQIVLSAVTKFRTAAKQQLVQESPRIGDVLQSQWDARRQQLSAQPGGQQPGSQPGGAVLNPGSARMPQIGGSP